MRATERRTWDIIVIGGGRPVRESPSMPQSVAIRFCLSNAATSVRAHRVEAPNSFTAASAIWRQGHIGSVRESLRERGRLRRNAPHVVHDLAFVLPCYSRWEKLKFGLGLSAYDLLAGRELWPIARHLREGCAKQNSADSARGSARRRRLSRWSVRRRALADRSYSHRR